VLDVANGFSDTSRISASVLNCFGIFISSGVPDPQWGNRPVYESDGLACSNFLYYDPAPSMWCLSASPGRAPFVWSIPSQAYTPDLISHKEASTGWSIMTKFQDRSAAVGSITSYKYVRKPLQVTCKAEYHAVPTNAPSAPTKAPTNVPTAAPSVPTSTPTTAPTFQPTLKPTVWPTLERTAAPTSIVPDKLVPPSNVNVPGAPTKLEACCNAQVLDPITVRAWMRLEFGKPVLAFAGEPQGSVVDDLSTVAYACTQKDKHSASTATSGAGFYSTACSAIATAADLPLDAVVIETVCASSPGMGAYASDVCFRLLVTKAFCVANGSPLFCAPPTYMASVVKGGEFKTKVGRVMIASYTHAPYVH
jgi:hypothetical protein